MKINKSNLKFIALFLFAFLGLIIGSFWVGSQIDIPLSEPLIKSLAQTAKGNTFWLKIWIIIAEFVYYLGNAFAEEIIFRGPLLLLLKAADKMKIPPFVPGMLAAVALSVVFSILHIRDFFLANVAIFFLGFLLSLLVYKYRSMMPAICFHAAWNMLIIFNPHMY